MLRPRRPRPPSSRETTECRGRPDPAASLSATGGGAESGTAVAPTSPEESCGSSSPNHPPPVMEKALWDANHTRIFCDICKDETIAGNRTGGCLSVRGYKNLESKFFERTNKRYVKKQFKNKWDHLKKEYTGWMELKSSTGLGWDAETGTIGAEDGWWRNHIANNPDHAKFRNGPSANLALLDEMFAHMTGESSAIPGEELGKDKVDDAPINVDESDDDVQQTALVMKKNKMAKCRVSSSMVDASMKEEKNPFLREYKKACNAFASSGEVSSCNKVPPSTAPSLKEVLVLIRECGAMEGTSLFYTACKLAMNPEYRELFSLIETKEGLLDWLQRAHDDTNK